MTDGDWLHAAAGTAVVRVRFGETDRMGVVYHPNYLVWFNDARDAALSALGVDVSRLEGAGLLFPVIEATCHYRRPARYGDILRVTATPLRTTVAKLVFRYEVRHAQNRSLLAKGRTTSVVTNAQGRLLLRLPEELRQAFNPAVTADTFQGAG